MASNEVEASMTEPDPPAPERNVQLQLSMGVAELARLRASFFTFDWLSLQLSLGTIWGQAGVVKGGLGFHGRIGKHELIGSLGIGESSQWYRDSFGDDLCRSEADESCEFPQNIHLFAGELAYLYHFESALWGLSLGVDYRFGYDTEKYDHPYVDSAFFPTANLLVAWDL